MNEKWRSLSHGKHERSYRCLLYVPLPMNWLFPKALRNRRSLTSVATGLLVGLSSLAWGQNSARNVDVASKPGGKWTSMKTQSVADISTARPFPVDENLNRYGGMTQRKEKTTGFFHTAKIDGRWWLIDPEGCLFVHRAVNSVSILRPSAAQAAWKKQFASELAWAEQTTAMLRSHGFNGLGAWSDAEKLRSVSHPLAYTRIWNFMSAYGKKRGGIYQKSGHTGYPSDCIFVFDPEFESFCEEHAKQLAKDKNDPYLLGHFSDNELPLREDALKRYLSLPAYDHGHRAALQWLRARNGKDAEAKNIESSDCAAFLEFMAERYFRIVGAAIKRHDPNHLYLGARFHGSALRLPELFRAAGKMVDVVSVNYYHAWTPDPKRMAMWAKEAGKPFLITEWYAKAEDSGMGNTSGAGWLVKTQRDRGLFYENFTLGLLASNDCVGWHWFKYIDNDPTDTRADPSNKDSNKGILNNRYAPYTPMLDSMKLLNLRAYGLIDHFAKD